MTTLKVLHISTSIQRPAKEVYDFVSDPRNLPKWALGLSKGPVTKAGDFWLAESPMGSVKIKFAEKNNFGIADHDVTIQSGETFHNPLRVLTNGDGSEVVFTLFRQSDMTDEKFYEDAEWVKKDLEKLKSVLENS